MKILVELGKKIRDLRERKGWSQKDLECASDVSQPVIHRLETHYYKKLDLETVEKLAITLGTTLDCMLELDLSKQNCENTYFKHLPENLLTFLEDKNSLPFLEEAYEKYINAEFTKAFR